MFLTTKTFGTIIPSSSCCVLLLWCLLSTFRNPGVWGAITNMFEFDTAPAYQGKAWGIYYFGRSEYIPLCGWTITLLSSKPLTGILVYMADKVQVDDYTFHMTPKSYNKDLTYYQTEKEAITLIGTFGNDPPDVAVSFSCVCMTGTDCEAVPYLTLGGGAPAQAQAEITTIQTQAEITTEEAQAEITTAEAQAEITTTEAQVDIPTTEAQVDIPTTEAQVDIPTTEAQVDIPTTEAQVDIPTTEAQVDIPTTEAQVDIPTTEAQVDIHTTEAQVDTPTTEAQVDIPTSEAQVDTPTTEAQVDIPTTEAQIDTPTTEAQVDIPTTEAQVDTPVAWALLIQTSNETGPPNIRMEKNVNVCYGGVAAMPPVYVRMVEICAIACLEHGYCTGMNFVPGTNLCTLLVIDSGSDNFALTLGCEFWKVAGN